MGDSVEKEKAREEIRSILRECATEGTVWNRHLKADDTIDIWREMNSVLYKYQEEPISFDVFYSSLDRFKRSFQTDFDEAAEVFLKILEPKQEPPEAEARRTRRRAASSSRRPAAQRTNMGRTSSITHAAVRLRRPVHG
jgi:hypothetical protein